MKLIVISHPETFCDEQQITDAIFDEGLKYFHLRKPLFSEHEMEQFITRISEKNYHKIILHSHYRLIEKYNLKGAHVNLQMLTLREKSKSKSEHTSLSLHSLNEIEHCNLKFDYAFLSPVFDSISKIGYKSTLDLHVVQKFLHKNKDTKIIALGGVDEEKIELVKELGFSGIALLGAVWQSSNPVEKFKRIKTACFTSDIKL